MSRLQLFWFGVWMCGVVFLTGCLGARYEPPLIETPGVLYRPASGGELPHRYPFVANWNYDPGHLLVYLTAVHERGFYTPPRLALYAWQTGDVIELAVPTEHGSMSMVSQGPQNWLAYVTDTATKQQVWLYDIEQQTATQITQGTFPALAADALQLAVWRGEPLHQKQLWQLNLETGEEDLLATAPLPKNKDERVFVCCTTWSPDGKQLAYVIEVASVVRNEQGALEERDELTIYDFESRTSRAILASRFLEEPSWSPDGHLLATIEGGGENTNLLLIDVSQECIVAELPIPYLDYAFWTPQEEKIALVYWFNLYFLDIEAAFGAPYHELKCS